MNRAVFLIFITGAAIFSPSAWAQDPAPFADFTFKRVKIPKPGATNRINVQIDPNEQAAIIRPVPPQETVPEAPKPAGKYAWYWDHVSPLLEDASSGRLENAVSQLNQSGGPSVATPRLQNMQDIANLYGKEILLATIGTQVSPAFVLAVMGVESGGRVAAVSSAGAAGLMQLMPATAERFGVKDRKDPVENIRGGVAYLDWLMKEFENDPVLVLAAYNAGENAVKKNGGVPDYAETRAYVPKVLAAWTVARGLCLSPPQLVSDGCVFAIREANKE